MTKISLLTMHISKKDVNSLVDDLLQIYLDFIEAFIFAMCYLSIGTIFNFLGGTVFCKLNIVNIGMTA